MSALQPQLLLDCARINRNFLNLDLQGLTAAELVIQKKINPLTLWCYAKHLKGVHTDWAHSTSHLGSRICLCSFRFLTSVDSLSVGEALPWHGGDPMLSSNEPRFPENDSE